MPSIGLGVLAVKNEKEVENTIISAFEKGYRKIDTASAYQNEQGVGIGLKQSGIPRKEILLTVTDKKQLRHFAFNSQRIITVQIIF